MTNPHINCSFCGNPLEEGEVQSIAGKPACGDCYFGQIGDEIEQHPIVSPEFVLRVEAQRELNKKPA
jgi:hypothetical protein